MQGLTIRYAIEASFTADQWGLGDGEDRDVAAETLNAALADAVNAEGSNPGFVYDSMGLVQAQFSDLGGDDVVPSALIVSVVNQVFGDDHE